MGYNDSQSVTVPDKQSMKFTGKERDAETGLDYFGARYMSAAQGRWTSPDPIVHPAQSEAGFETFISEPQRWNKYAYVSNNPLKYTDPNGAEQVVGCIGGVCYNNVTGQVIPRQSTADMLRTLAIPVAGMAGVAGGSWLAGAWQGLSALVLGTAPRWEPIVVDAIDGYINPAAGGRLTIGTGQTKLNAAEIDTGVRLARQTGEALAQGAHVSEEFIDSFGRTYDAVNTPKAFANWATEGQNVLKNIQSTARKSVDFVAVDLKGASKAQISTIKSFVKKELTKPQQDKIIYVN